MSLFNKQISQNTNTNPISFTPSSTFQDNLKIDLQQHFKSDSADIQLKDYVRTTDRKGNTVIHINCELTDNKKSIKKEYAVVLTRVKEKNTHSKTTISSAAKTDHAKSSLANAIPATSQSATYRMQIKKQPAKNKQTVNAAKSPEVFQQHFPTVPQKSTDTLKNTSETSVQETSSKKGKAATTLKHRSTISKAIKSIASFSKHILRTTKRSAIGLKRATAHQGRKISKGTNNATHKLSHNIFHSSISVDKGKIQVIKEKLANPINNKLTNDELKIALSHLKEFTAEQNITCLNNYVILNKKDVLEKYLSKSGFTPGYDLPQETMQKNVDILEKHLDNIINYGILYTANSELGKQVEFKEEAQALISKSRKALRDCKHEQQKIEKAVAPLKQMTSKVVTHLQNEMIGESKKSWEQARKEKLETIFSDLTKGFENFIQQRIGTPEEQQKMMDDLSKITSYHALFKIGHALPNNKMLSNAMSEKTHSLTMAMKNNSSQLSVKEKTNIDNTLKLLDTITTIDELELKTHGEFKRDGYPVDFKEVSNVVTYADQVKLDIKIKHNEYVFNPELDTSKFYERVDWKTGLIPLQDPKTGKTVATALFQKSAPMLEKQIGSGGSADIFLMHYATGVRVQKRPNELNNTAAGVKEEFAREADFATRIRPEAESKSLSLRGLPEEQKIIDKGEFDFCIESRFYNEGDLEGFILKNSKAAMILTNATNNSLEDLTAYFDRKTGTSQAFADMLSALETLEALNYSQLDQKLSNMLIDKKSVGSYEGQASDFGSVIDWNSWSNGSVSSFIKILHEVPITDNYHTKSDLETFNALKDKIKSSSEDYGAIYTKLMEQQGTAICLNLIKQELSCGTAVFKDDSTDVKQLEDKPLNEVLEHLTNRYKNQFQKTIEIQIRNMAKEQIPDAMDRDTALKEELKKLSEAPAMRIGDLTLDAINKLSLPEAIFALKAISEKMVIANIGLNCYQFQHPAGENTLLVPNDKMNHRTFSADDLKNDPQAIKDFIMQATDPDADKRPNLKTLLQTTGLVSLLDKETQRMQNLTKCLNACRSSSNAITKEGTLSITSSQIETGKQLNAQIGQLKEIQKSTTDITEKKLIGNALKQAEQALLNFEITRASFKMQQKRATVEG